MSILTLIPKLLFFAVIIAIVYLIYQRNKEKNDEDFEDRPN